jgi:trimethylamine--corrinoid protein Co-methyltransferase
MLKGFTRKFAPLKILTEEQIQAIHRGTLGVLSETGVRLEHERALKILDKNGCQVDYDQMRARIPPGLAEECLRRCPSSFHLKARDAKHDLLIGGNTTYFVGAPGMQTVDLNTWEPRDATMQEYYDAVTILDALPHYHLFCCYTPYFGFDGVPEVMKIPEGFAARTRNSTKFSWSCFSGGSEVFNIRIAQVAGMETIIPGGMASPPLTFYRDAIECAFRTLESGMPIAVDTGTVFGATGPATLTGSLVIYNAELIAGIVLIQLVKPGVRTSVFGFPHPQNMRTGAPAFGAIGISLFNVALNQIWHKYGVPLRNTAPAYTNSKEIDYQSGYERAIPAILGAISGVHFLHLHGGMHGELTHHPVQSILDDDVAGMIGRFIEGIQVDNETLAIDLINEVGPIPGNYLNRKHTRDWWKQEQFLPRAADRLTYPEWRTIGKKNCLDYAKDIMAEILATHKVSKPLTSSQHEDIGKILKEAREHYRKNGLISDKEWEIYKSKVIKSPDYPFA